MNRPNIVLIVLDTLRYDILINNIDKFETLSWLFRQSHNYSNAISPAPWTTPSHASMFTGLYPSEHRMISQYDDNRFLEAIAHFPTFSYPISRVASDNGYHTRSLVANLGVGEGTPFSEGFDEVKNFGGFNGLWRFYREQRKLVGLGLNWSDVGQEKVLKQVLYNPATLSKIIELEVKKALFMVKVKYPIEKGYQEIAGAFLDTNFKDDFFVFINLMEMHEPYNILDEFHLPKWMHISFNDMRGVYIKKMLFNEKHSIQLSEKLKSVKIHLSKQVELLDKFLYRIVSTLKNNNVYEKTVIIVTSDHGQSLGENDFVGHGYLLTDPIVRVPLLIKEINSIGVTHDDYVSTVDLYYYITNLIHGLPGAFPSREYIISEGYGFTKSEWKSLLGDKFMQYLPDSRKRIFDRFGNNLTINGTQGTVEDCNIDKVPPNFQKNEIKTKLLEELEIFNGNQNFKIPTRTFN